MSDDPNENEGEFGLPEKDDADFKPGGPQASEADIAATLDAMIGGGSGAEEAPSRGSGFGSYTNMSALGQVPVEVQVVLGRARLPIGNILKLGRGAVVEIDRRVGEQVEIHINHRPVARGEIVIVDDDRLGVTLTEIITNAANLH
jgi:flagellar motor switch protein FliN/FliY